MGVGVGVSRSEVSEQRAGLFVLGFFYFSSTSGQTVETHRDVLWPAGNPTAEFSTKARQPKMVPRSARPRPTSTFGPSQHLLPIAGIRLIGSGFGTELCSQQAPQSELLPRADPPLTVEHLLPVRLILDVFAPVAHIAQLLVLQEQKNTGQEMTLEEHSQTRVTILFGLRQPLAATSWQ